MQFVTMPPMGDLPPTPQASSPHARRAMQGNRRTNTNPEVSVRRLLHRAGLRYRVDFPVVAGETRVRPDVVFTRQKVCLFVDGCYWHGCPDHCRIPASNREYWEAKIARNRARDERVTLELERSDWIVVRAWEHDPVEKVLSRVLAALAR